MNQEQILPISSLLKQRIIDQYKNNMFMKKKIQKCFVWNESVKVKMEGILQFYCKNKFVNFVIK